MADKKKDGVVEYADADGNTRWAAEDSKAYQDHLRAKDSKGSKPARTESAKVDVKTA